MVIFFLRTLIIKECDEVIMNTREKNSLKDKIFQI